MNITEVVLSRSSIRSFLDNPVSDELITILLEKASRAASGGNLQPWKIFILNNSAMKDFLEFQESWTEPEVPAYEIYPPKLKEPYRTSRFELGEQMY
jgi:nitroreductase